MIPRLITSPTVLNMLYRLGGVSRQTMWTYPETAQAIAHAVASDPLFPAEQSGAEATACILVATAWDRSRLQPYLRIGNRLGLFQIRPPGYPRIQADVLLRPRNACLVAVDLIRTSLLKMKERPWSERLGWFIDLGAVDGPIPDDPGLSAVGRSMIIMKLARTLYERRFAGEERLVLERVVENVSESAGPRPPAWLYGEPPTRPTRAVQRGLLLSTGDPAKRRRKALKAAEA